MKPKSNASAFLKLQLFCEPHPAVCAAALLAGIFFLAMPSRATAQQPCTSRVVTVTNKAAIKDFAINEEILRDMLMAGLMQWTDKDTLPDAVRCLVKPGDLVGVRISTAGGPTLAVKKQILATLVDSMFRVGIEPRNVIVWDKKEEDMLAAKFHITTSPRNIRYLSVVPGTGFDISRFYMFEMMGQLIWGDHEFKGDKPTREEILAESTREAAERAAKKAGLPLPPAAQEIKRRQESAKSYFAKIASQYTTKIINLAVFSDSDTVGFEGCVAGLALASVDNTRRFQGPPMFGNPALAEILAEEPLKKKTVFHILDGMLAQYAGGPSFQPKYCKPHATLYFGTDPVAIDSMAVERADKWRAADQLPPIKPLTQYLQTATKLGLGECDLSKVKVEHLEP